MSPARNRVFLERFFRRQILVCLMGPSVPYLSVLAPAHIHLLRHKSASYNKHELPSTAYNRLLQHIYTFQAPYPTFKAHNCLSRQSYPPPAIHNHLLQQPKLPSTTNKLAFIARGPLLHKSTFHDTKPSKAQICLSWHVPPYMANNIRLSRHQIPCHEK